LSVYVCLIISVWCWWYGQSLVEDNKIFH